MVGESYTLQENASRLARFALEMQRACAEVVAPDGSPVVMRIGLHSGPVVGGIVGGNMLRYQFRFISPHFLITCLFRLILKNRWETNIEMTVAPLFLSVFVS